MKSRLHALACAILMPSFASAALIRMDLTSCNDTTNTASGTLAGNGFTIQAMTTTGPGGGGFIDGNSVTNSGSNDFNSPSFHQPQPNTDRLAVWFADSYRISFTTAVAGLYLDVWQLDHWDNSANTITFTDQDHNPLSFTIIASNGEFINSTAVLQTSGPLNTSGFGTLFFAGSLTQLNINSDGVMWGDGGYLNMGVVPEPSTGALLVGMAFAGLLARRKHA